MDNSNLFFSFTAGEMVIIVVALVLLLFAGSAIYNHLVSIPVIEVKVDIASKLLEEKIAKKILQNKMREEQIEQAANLVVEILYEVGVYLGAEEIALQIVRASAYNPELIEKIDEFCDLAYSLSKL